MALIDEQGAVGNLAEGTGNAFGGGVGIGATAVATCETRGAVGNLASHTGGAFGGGTGIAIAEKPRKPRRVQPPAPRPTSGLGIPAAAG